MVDEDRSCWYLVMTFWWKFWSNAKDLVISPFRKISLPPRSSNKYRFYIFCCWICRTTLIVLHRHSLWLWTFQNGRFISYSHWQAQERRSPIVEIFRMQLAIDPSTSINRNNIAKASCIPSTKSSMTTQRVSTTDQRLLCEQCVAEDLRLLRTKALHYYFLFG